MNKRIINTIPEILSQLNRSDSAGKDAFLGFDACIDNIVRIVKDREENNGTEFFNSSRQFGEFLINLDNRSCGVELQTKLSKLGGNMVITANALGNLGINLECIGTFGLPDILPVFRSMSTNCTLHTIGETISATALEFNESKVIVFDPGPYNELTWEGIKEKLGHDQIKELLSGKQLISFLNWSEIANSSLIWKGFLDEILPFLEHPVSQPIFFTDFSDCSRKSGKEIKYAIDLLSGFRKYFKVILSLNQNETDLIARALDVSPVSSEEGYIKSLFDICNVDIVVIHRVKDALAFDGSVLERCDTFLCKEPVVLTGGGDNFNAGFCFAQLNNLDLFQSLLIANTVSGSYVKTGISPNISDLISFLTSFKSIIR